ncbi:MAG: DUF5915 domain-containing protein, partial [Methanopyri archaeon]|nr:DUF5915 domain-containing protein [Methanopyri archaeon]
WREDLSRWYVQNKRPQIAAGDETTLAVLSHVYLGLLRLVSPMVPMTAEAIYQDLRKEYGLKEETIHLQEWIEADTSRIDKDIERDMEILRDVTTNVLAAREKVNRGVRWPLRNVDVITRDKRVISVLAKQGELVKRLTNAWELVVKQHEESLTHVVKPDFARIGPKHKGLAGAITKAIQAADSEKVVESLDRNGSFTVSAGDHEVVIERDEVFIEETVPDTIYSIPGTRFSIYVDLEENEDMLSSGLAREVVRHVQSLRKKAELVRADRIKLTIAKDVVGKLEAHTDEITSTVGADELEFGTVKGREFTTTFTSRETKVTVGFDKV